MAKLRHNVIANFLGQGWTALVGVLFIPVYIRVLGPEAYGLIGLYVSMQGLLYVLDIGLSSTLNRELARQARTAVNAGAARDLVYTLELMFLPICLVAAAAISALSSDVASNWLQPVEFTPERVAHALQTMGLAVALQWPAAFYAGGLNGLEHQVRVNVVTAVFATLRWAGVVPLVLRFGTIEVFLYWQIGVAAAQTIATRALLLEALPGEWKGRRFQRDVLVRIKGFALGMFAISAVAFVLIQLDRIVLSRVLPLDQFGRYALAAMVAAGLTRSYQPFFIALYPRYTSLLAADDHELLKILYHQSSQFLAVLVSSTAAVLVLFARDVLAIWTGDLVLAAQVTPVLQVLVVAAALNGMMNLPYALQLAHGWIRLTLWMNLAILPIAIFAAWRLALEYGGIGAATVWLGVNLAFLCIGLPIMHSRLLPRELSRWFLRDVLPPLATASLAAALLRMAVPSIERTLGGLLLLALIALLTLVSASLATPATRGLMRRALLRVATP